MIDKFNLIIRIFVDLSVEESKQLFNDIKNLFQKDIINFEVQKYYKEKWYEISFQIIEINLTPNQAIKEYSEKLGTDWNIIYSDSDNDYTAYSVWNKSDNNKFNLPKTQFATIDIFKE